VFLNRTRAALLLLGFGFACSSSEPDAGNQSMDSGSVDASTDVSAESATPDAGAANDAGGDDAAVDGTQPKPEIRVLFVGNSYTAVNGMPAVLAELGKSAQSPATFMTVQHTPGGATWEQHDANPAVDQLIQQGWDTVVLQDQSSQPWSAKGIKPALLSLDQKIQASGAQTMLFMTWARIYLPTLSPPHYAQAAAVNQYYERHAAAIGARVAPVGRAWERALNDPAQSLHSADGSHPNPRGSYLAACVFYATLTDQSPVGLGPGGLGLSGAERAELQQVAWETHQAKQRLASPAIGFWPLGVGPGGQDLMTSQQLAVGGVPGPGGALIAGTQFGPNQFAAVPYFPGLNSAKITVAINAYRADWSSWTNGSETLFAKSWAYRLTHTQNSLEAALYTTNATDSGAYVKVVIDTLAPGWHQFAITYDGAALELWVDAQPVASDTSPGEVRYYGLNPDEIARYDAVAVGANKVDTALSGASPAPFFTGALAGLRIFDRALTQSELQKL
jgi:hypothetical protein